MAILPAPKREELVPRLTPQGVLLVAVFTLLGCSATVPVTGQLQGNRGTFTGSATGYSDGSGELAIVTNAGVSCKGSYVFIDSRQGEGTFTCVDGRTGPFHFASTGSRGTGTGNLNGALFTFTFG
jgi:hypothetical protein